MPIFPQYSNSAVCLWNKFHPFVQFYSDKIRLLYFPNTYISLFHHLSVFVQ